VPSIRELRDHKQRESFTGRRVELNTFRRLLTAGEAEYAILHVYGVGGVGKSSLLRQFRRIAQETGCPVASVDMQVHFGVSEILRSIREQVGQGHERAFAEFDKALDMFNDVRSKLQGAVGSLASGVVSGLREGVPLGLGALAVDTVGEEQMKAWLYHHLPRANADLYLHGERVLTEKLIPGLNRLAEHNGSKLVILFDTYEQSSQAQDDWLRDTFLDSDLSSNVLIGVAGRDPLPDRWHEWRSVLLSRQLQPFTDQEAQEYLTRRGITDPALTEALLSFTERLPWALALATDTPGARDMTAADFVRTSHRHTIGDKLVERFVSQVQDDAEMRELVDVCAVVRTFDHDVVRALWGREAVDEPLERLRHYSFVRVRPNGRWSLNQVVREFLDQGLRRRSSSRWTELNQRAAAFYQESTTARPHYSGEWNWLTLESLYHRLRLNEDEGISYFASLFEEAMHLSRYDFCSELLNTVQDVQMIHPYSEHWLTFYRGVITRVANISAWDQAHAINQALYRERDLPPTLRARVTTDLGRYYYQIAAQYEQGIAMLDESLALRRELKDEDGQAHVLSHLAVAHSASGDFERGRACGLACIQLAEKLDAPYRLGWGYFSLGVIESRAGDQSNALDYFQRSLNTFESAGYEFEPGVVHYHIGRLSLEMKNLDTALKHFETNLKLMHKYDKQVLAARTMVDICELDLLRQDTAHLAQQAAETEKMILDQGNATLLARLRLIQAEALLQDKNPAVETVTSLYLEALLAAAGAPRLMLYSVIERIEARLNKLAAVGGASLAHTVSQTLASGVVQALEGTLARRGQLIVLPAHARQSLLALALAQRWACIGQEHPPQPAPRRRKSASKGKEQSHA
jgi:tetratricopeptide (TPR) repeat protein